MNEKVLFIDSWNNVGDFFREERNKIKGLDNVNLYKNNSFVNKMFRWIGLKIFKPFLYFSYGNWKKDIYKYDIFILESRKSFEYALKFIKKKTNKRVIVWYWNEVTEREIEPYIVVNKYNCEAWSFDKKNAEKYNMKFNNTYYFSTVNLPKKNIENDVFYVGIDREGRIEKLKELSNYFNKCGLKYNFNLTTSPIKMPEKTFQYKERLSYKDVLNEIAKSKVILDLTKETQYGLTLRPVEALFFEKKLITDNKNIKEYNFYNPKNIFILGEDNLEKLNEFIDSKYEKIDEKKIEEYDFKNWLNRIIN